MTGADMTPREELKKLIAAAVTDRLVKRSESLEGYGAFWRGTSSGIEGWLRVEFVVAVAELVGQIQSGGAGKKVNPDLVLVTKKGAEIPVELKASTDWWLKGSFPWRRYGGHFLAFLLGSPYQNLEENRHEVLIRDQNAIINEICAFHRPGKPEPEKFYFGIADIKE